MNTRENLRREFSFDFLPGSHGDETFKTFCNGLIKNFNVVFDPNR